jgi:O-antigen/teichoic acid export membrane protein
MIKQFKRLSKQTLIYGFGDVIIKAIAFLLLPLYTRHLEPGEFGELALVQAIEVALPIILSLGFNSAILKVCHDYTDQTEQHTVISTALLFIFFSSLPVLVFLFFQAEFLAKLIDFSSIARYTWCLKVTFVTVFFSLFRLMSLSILRIYERSILFSVLNILHFTLLVSLNIYFMVFRGMKIEGIILSNVLTSGLVFLLILTLILVRFGFHFSKEKLVALLHFGLPLVPGGLASWTLTLADRYLLRFLADTEQVGFYDVGYKFGMIVNMLLVHPFRTAWLPFIFSIQKDPNANKIYANTFTYFMLIGTVMCLALTLFAREMVVLTLAPEFYPGYQAIPFIALAYLLFGIYNTVDVGVLLTSKTGMYAIISWTGAALNIGLALILIPQYGVIGAGIAKILAFAALALLMFKAAQRCYPIPYQTSRIFTILAVALALFFSSLLLPDGALFATLLIKTGLLSLFPIVLLLTGFFTPREKEIAWNFVRRVIFRQSAH